MLSITSWYVSQRDICIKCEILYKRSWPIEVRRLTLLSAANRLQSQRQRQGTGAKAELWRCRIGRGLPRRRESFLEETGCERKARSLRYLSLFAGGANMNCWIALRLR